MIKTLASRGARSAVHCSKLLHLVWSPSFRLHLPLVAPFYKQRLALFTEQMPRQISAPVHYPRVDYQREAQMHTVKGTSCDISVDWNHMSINVGWWREWGRDISQKKPSWCFVCFVLFGRYGVAQAGLEFPLPPQC